MFNDYFLKDAMLLVQNKPTNKEQITICSKENQETIVPETYNFREEYKECARPIFEQKNCSSSYSIAPISAVSDRWCQSNRENHPVLSPQTPLACDKVINNRCESGYVTRTLDIAKVHGLVEQSCYPHAETLDSYEECTEAVKSCQRFKIQDYCVTTEEETLKK